MNLGKESIRNTKTIEIEKVASCEVANMLFGLPIGIPMLLDKDKSA